jgi:hypothetical protein
MKIGGRVAAIVYQVSLESRFDENPHDLGKGHGLVVGGVQTILGKCSE